MSDIAPAHRSGGVASASQGRGSSTCSTSVPMLRPPVRVPVDGGCGMTARGGAVDIGSPCSKVHDRGHVDAGRCVPLAAVRCHRRWLAAAGVRATPGPARRGCSSTPSSPDCVMPRRFSSRIGHAEGALGHRPRSTKLRCASGSGTRDAQDQRLSASFGDRYVVADPSITPPGKLPKKPLGLCPVVRRSQSGATMSTEHT
jgi:hypothetical protein